MTNKSWEIIIAGLVFIGISVYLMNLESSTKVSETPPPQTDSLEIQILNNGVKVIALEKLSNLDNLKNLEGLQELGKLEKIKTLANFMPVEVKNDFINEINKVISEIDHELVDVQVDIQKGLISIESIKNVKPGTWNAISPGVYAFVKEFDASEIKNTTLEIPFGSITVVGTENNKAKLVIQASGKIESEVYLQDRLQTSANIEDESARFLVQSTSATNVTDNLHLQATLNIPIHSALSLKTLGGHITASNIDGNQIYFTNGGHISLENVKGEVHANTNGGHISLKDSQGKLTLETLGGHIKTVNSSGNLTLITSGGNIIAEKFQGSINAHTKGGNVELNITAIDGPIEAETVAGTVKLTFPIQINADINATANTVDLDSAFEFSGSKSSGNIIGEIGTGGTLIHAKSGYGKVVITTK